MDYRVLVADDGSSDRTAALTRRPGAAVLDAALAPQGGKGRAVRTAMLRATGRVLAFTDADLPFELTALRQGYEWIRCGAVRRGLRRPRHRGIGAPGPAAAVRAAWPRSSSARSSGGWCRAK